MAAYWALALVLLAATVTNASGSRIVGGDPTTINNYPSIVQVETAYPWLGTWVQTCAANIITMSHVVSAAHCFSGSSFQLEERRIRAGSSNRNTGGVIVTFASRTIHPDYGLNGYDADICVATLRSPLTYTPVIQPVTIIAQYDPQLLEPVLPDNLPVVHVGWGSTSSWSQGSPILRDVTIFTINNKLCTDRYAAWSPTAVVTKNMICAGILDVGGKDACQGDSGGPLYYKQPAPASDLLVGIVSWGRGCAESRYPGVSTSVASYTNWIIAQAV